jgi:DNA-binding response OmpR family regulator
VAGRPLILVVVDEPDIAEAVAARLRSESLDVAIAGDGPTAVDRCEARRPDLVMLGLLLPGFDGLEVCRRIQRERPVPVLMLTARDDEADVVIGLGVGADDYLTKPFSMRELVARVGALLRRAERASAPTGSVQLGEVEIDAPARKVRRAGADVHLTPTEFDLLWCLAAADGAVRTRQQLLLDVWGYRDGSGARTVDSHVRSLRRKLGDELIRTVHGVGYAVERDA